jgi:hypothetical protein
LFRLSIALFALVGVSLLSVGCVYLSLSQFMPYHAEALQLEWDSLDANFQGLILGLLKGLGSGAFVAGTAVVWMAGKSLRQSPRPFVTLMPFVAISYSSLLCFATYTVYTNTPGNPPLLLNFLLVVASVLASAALAVSRRDVSGK